MSRSAHTKAHCTAMDPVTTGGESPILSGEGRAEIVASLKAAEARIAGGQYVEHDSTTFVDRLMRIRAAAIRNASS